LKSGVQCEFPIKLKNTLLVAAFSLITSIIAASGADIPITTLPFNITAPGTYVLTGNLSFPQSQSNAITINSTVVGAVDLNFRRFAITGGGGSSVAVYIGTQGISNTYPITVRNGTLINFGFGVMAATAIHTPSMAHLTYISVNKLVFANEPSPNPYGTGVKFQQVDFSTVNNCIFNHNGVNGIQDSLSAGGNSYLNDTFMGVNPLSVDQDVPQIESITTVIEHCTFESSPTPFTGNNSATSAWVLFQTLPS
jgi:hypothetical protein